jgi:signal transduction histidine kinase
MLPFPDRKKTLLYYLIGVGASVAALLLREILGEVFGAHYPYHTVWLAVIFVAWYCGIGPSIVAVAIDALGIWYWFLRPYDSFVGKDRVEYLGLLGFLLFSWVIIVLGESNRRLFLKRRQAERALEAANDELEQRVEQRTGQLRQSNDAARRLNAKILTLQDEERRHIARALHDSLGQYLTALKIDLDTFAAADATTQAKMIADCSDIVQRCLVETRTISHLLHPPLLDESGFSSATRLYVDGFSRRSGVSVDLDFPDIEIRLPHNVEIALFRAVQEALTNIHRHSGASKVDVRLTASAAETRLTIKDNGKGIAPEALRALQNGTTNGGVGIAGMRERVRDLNGVLEVGSSTSGTTIVIAVPTAEEKYPALSIA